jgi:hypothetical protein
MQSRKPRRKGRPKGRPFVLTARTHGGYRVDDLAIATAVAGNVRFTTDPDGLYNELLGDLGRDKTERIWKLAGEIEDAYNNTPDAA